jgi:HAD superfamily hydrolase (TIGR01509 family)
MYMEEIKAVILDFDGLMVDSEPLSMKAWQKLLAELGHTIEHEEFREIIGMEAIASADFLCRRKGLSIRCEEVVDRHYQYWMTITQEEAQPVEGLLDLIEAVGEHGRKLGIASNSRSEYVEGVLKKIHLDDRFECVITSDRVAKGKPAPDVYLISAACLGVRPETCLAVEDSPPGLESALRAGMRCVVVPNQDLIHEAYEGAFARYPSLKALEQDLHILFT